MFFVNNNTWSLLLNHFDVYKAIKAAGMILIYKPGSIMAHRMIRIAIAYSLSITNKRSTAWSLLTAVAMQAP